MTAEDSDQWGCVSEEGKEEQGGEEGRAYGLTDVGGFLARKVPGQEDGTERSVTERVQEQESTVLDRRAGQVRERGCHRSLGDSSEARGGEQGPWAGLGGERGRARRWDVYVDASSHKGRRGEEEEATNMRG